MPLVSPLCGKPVKSAAQRRLRPVAVKVDNHPEARPQSGLADACVVYEHMAEGGITRFTAIYQSEETNPIGPVRSARLVDLELVPQYQALFAHVGASAPIMRMLAESDLLDLDQFFYGGYWRVNWRYAPYNVYTSVPALRSEAQARGWSGEADSAGFAFSENFDHSGWEAGQAVTITFSDYNVVEYRYDATRKAYLRFVDGEPHLDAESGEQLAARNVVVQYVESELTDIIEDVGGAHSVRFKLSGHGRALVFRDGYRLEARWERKGKDELTRFLDPVGNPISFAPGSLWIALADENTQVTSE